MEKIPCLDLKGQQQQVKKEVFELFEKVYEQTAFSGGPFVAEFEKDFEKWQEMDTWYQDEEKEETRTFLEELFEGYRTSGGVTTKLFAKEGYQQETDF